MIKILLKTRGGKESEFDIPMNLSEWTASQLFEWNDLVYAANQTRQEDPNHSEFKGLLQIVEILAKFLDIAPKYLLDTNVVAGKADDYIDVFEKLNTKQYKAIETSIYDLFNFLNNQIMTYKPKNILDIEGNYRFIYKGESWQIGKKYKDFTKKGITVGQYAQIEELRRQLENTRTNNGQNKDYNYTVGVGIVAILAEKVNNETDEVIEENIDIAAYDEFVENRMKHFAEITADVTQDALFFLRN